MYWSRRYQHTTIHIDPQQHFIIYWHHGYPSYVPLHLFRHCPLLDQAPARCLFRNPTIEICLCGGRGHLQNLQPAIDSKPGTRHEICFCAALQRILMNPPTKLPKTRRDCDVRHRFCVKTLGEKTFSTLPYLPL